MSSQKDNIMAIHADTTLSKEEKNKAIQQLMTRHCSLPSSSSAPCTHYKKKCSHFFFGCCQTHDDCMRCHRENHTECAAPRISTVVCDECGCEQLPQHCCSQCGVAFQQNYCGICFLWTDLDITHCVECGLCRVGKPEELYHCRKCGVCFSAHLNHVCVDVLAKKPAREMQCSMCLESTFDSQDGCSFTQCGHTIHTGCMKKAVDNQLYKCGICRKSILDMTFMWVMMQQEIGFQEMPSEFMRFRVGEKAKSRYGLMDITEVGEEMVSGKLDFTPNAVATFQKRELKQMVEVYCNDCEQKSWTDLHFIGNMCQECGGFNTSRM
jgi:RING finger/CHY zinc finger protein 1